MANPNNFGVLTGRVSQDKRVFENRDGSKTLLVSIAVDDNFRSGPDNKAQTQFISGRAFIPKGTKGLGSWDRVGKGDLISVGTRLAAAPYQKDGKTVFPDVQVEFPDFPQFLESKTVTEERAARNAVAAAAKDAPAETAPETEGADEIARLRAQLADAEAKAGVPSTNYDETSPFAGAAA